MGADGEPDTVPYLVHLTLTEAILDAFREMIAEGPKVIGEAEKPAYTIVLPPGYTLPPHLIPTTETVLSENEKALIETDKWVKQEHPNFDNSGR